MVVFTWLLINNNHRFKSVFVVRMCFGGPCLILLWKRLVLWKFCYENVFAHSQQSVCVGHWSYSNYFQDASKLKKLIFSGLQNKAQNRLLSNLGSFNQSVLLRRWNVHFNNLISCFNFAHARERLQKYLLNDKIWQKFKFPFEYG